ncbi:MAG: TonB-dependent receptor [Novosphingobium sp.]
MQDVAPGETRASIGVAGGPGVIGTDAGSDLNNDGVVGGAGEIYGRPAGADFFGWIDPDGAGPLFSSDFAFKDQGHVDTWGLNLRAKFELSDSITLSSITDYKKYKKLLFIDVDAGPANQLANYGSVDAESFTQELRLNGKSDRLNWVLGAYFLHINNLSRNGLKAPINGLVPGNPIDIASTARLKTTSFSAFGQIDYDLSDKFRVVVGARIIQEKKDYDFIQELYFNPDSLSIQPAAGLLFPIGPIYPGGVPSRYLDNDSRTLFAGKVQFEYRPNDDTLIYVGVNRGVKAGSYNAQLNGGLPTPDSAIKYGDETLWSYEGGFKLSLANNVRLNGAVYYYDYKNYQSFLFTGVAGLVVNADARTYGGELSLQANPVRGLDLALAVSAFDAKVKDVPLRVGGPIRRDVKPTYAPETQISGMVRYGWDAFGGEMSVKGDGSYSSSYYYNLRNFDADKYPGYFLLNLGLGWTSASKNLELGVDIQNVTNRQIGIQGFDLATLCGCNEVSYKLPRTFSVHARVNF